MPLQPLPAFDDNYIWSLSDTSGEALLIDPGEAAPVFRAAERGLRPVAVLITHHHGDHIGGVAALMERWPGLEVFAPEEPRIDLPCRRVGDGDVVAVRDWRFRMLDVPGHTRSHIAFFAADIDGGLLFCGDTLFSLGCGRLFEGTPAQMSDSLDRIAGLPDTARVCCAHEYTLANAAFAATVDPDNPALRARIAQVRALRAEGRPSLPVTLSEELATNPFLRCGSAPIREAVAARLGRAPQDRVETFAGLRAWKDVFRA